MPGDTVTLLHLKVVHHYVVPGQKDTLSVTIASTKALSDCRVIIEASRVSSKGAEMQLGTYRVDGIELAAGKSLKFKYVYDVPSTMTRGTIVLRLGVFDASGMHRYAWSPQGVTVHVKGGKPAPDLLIG